VAVTPAGHSRIDVYDAVVLADILVTDFKMPNIDGMKLLMMSKQARPNVPVILLTGCGDIPTAVKAMRNGAYDFLEKPFTPDHFIEVLHKSMEHVRLVAEVERLRSNMASLLENCLIGTSEQARRLRAKVAEIASIDTDVLIEGDTGTGKEVVARALHDFGSRAGRPFVAINCAGVPMDIAESELFGSVLGAFTGAVDRAGKFEQANGGTLFLDEIESMPLGLQAKVLRVIEERAVVRVGGNKNIPIKIRIVTATKPNLAEESKAGRFREDLFYRLNKIKIRLPRLRDRKDDIPLLFKVFSSNAARRHKRKERDASPCDVACLLTHDWPGNIRELKTVAERFALGFIGEQSVSEILDGADYTPAEDVSILDGSDRTPNEDTSLSARVAAYERFLLVDSLTKNRGNLAAVMDDLKIPRRTLYDKMDRYGLDRALFVASSDE
jgi:two-component system C4-dicarboxylate transport response regulator DctD